MTACKLGVIGAMESEVSLLRSQLKDARPHRVLGMDFVEGSIAGLRLVVARCGIGKVNAALCAQAMICSGVTHVINTGVAGSLDAALNIGDIVVSTDAVEHDLDVTALGYAPGEHPDLRLVGFEADAGLRAAVCEAARAAAPEVRVVEGRVCSGDQFIGSGPARERIIRSFGGLCCEMEGAAIAHACWLARLPFVIVRAISDKADSSSSVAYPEFERVAAERSARIVLAALPRIA